VCWFVSILVIFVGVNLSQVFGTFCCVLDAFNTEAGKKMSERITTVSGKMKELFQVSTQANMRTKFKETGGLHSGRRSRAPTSLKDNMPCSHGWFIIIFAPELAYISSTLMWPVPLAQVWTHYKIGKLNMWTLFCNACIDIFGQPNMKGNHAWIGW